MTTAGGQRGRCGGRNKTQKENRTEKAKQTKCWTPVKYGLKERKTEAKEPLMALSVNEGCTHVGPG